MSSRQAVIAERFVCSGCLAIFRSGYPRCPLCGAQVQTLEGDPLVGRVLHNRYKIAECVGEGGMGRVYRAVHEYTGKQHAVKVLFGDHAADPKMRARMEQEAMAVGKLSHRNVIAVTDAAKTDDNSFYLVMDFVEGENLATIVAREAPFAPERVVTLVKQLCMGLGHAHDNRLVHRDFKSENVLVTRDADGELAKIVDFGIAVVLEAAHAGHKLTSEGMVLGTPAFMSPEQSTGAKVDHRSDLFSLGVMMYEMLCGKLPFDGSPLDIARQNLVSTPPPIAERVPSLAGVVDPELEKVAFRLMEKRPEARFQSAHEVLAVLDRLDVGLGVPRPRITSQPAYDPTIHDSVSRVSITSESPATPSVQISQLPYEETIATPVPAGARSLHGRASENMAFAQPSSPGYRPESYAGYQTDTSSPGHHLESRSSGRFWFKVAVVGTILVGLGYLGASQFFERTSPQAESAFNARGTAPLDTVAEDDITLDSEFDHGNDDSDPPADPTAPAVKVAKAGSAAASPEGADNAGADAGASAQDDPDETQTPKARQAAERKAAAERRKEADRKAAARKERVRRRQAKANEAKPKAKEPERKKPTPVATSAKSEEPQDDFVRYRRLYQQVGRALDNTGSPPPRNLVSAYLGIKFQSGIMNATLRKEYIRRLLRIKAGLKRWKQSQK